MPVNSFENYPMSWKPDLTELHPPLYKALALLLESDIKQGKLAPGTLLPPQRELADYLDLNLSTITKAFKLCSQKGLISANVGKGTYVSTGVHANPTLLDPQKTIGLIEMGAIHPTYEQNQFILNVIKETLDEPSAPSILEYSAPCGTDLQKKIGVNWLKRTHIVTTFDHILLANGGQNALCAILSSLFHPGDRIGTDPLIFPGIKTLASMLAIELVPIQQEGNEMSPAALERLCSTEGLKGIYLIPDYQNPTTHTMTESTRKAISHIAERYNLIIIEDAIHRLFNPELLPSFAELMPLQTIHIASLSKALCAGLHIAFIMTPNAYKEKLERGLYNTNLMVSPLCATAVCNLISSSKIDHLIEERRQIAYARNQLTNEIMKDYSLLGDLYTTFRLLLLPDSWNGRTFENCAKKAGVQVYCLERFAIGNSEVPAAVRIATSSPKNLDELAKGLRILRSILDYHPGFTLF